MQIMEYELKIWYRYANHGELEKDYDIRKIEALGIHDAFRKIKEKFFDGYNAIPFSYGQVINGNEPLIWYDPFKQTYFDDFEKPLSELNKEY